MTRHEARRQLSSLPPEQVDKLFDEALKAAGLPRSKRYTERNTGIYNTVALPDVVDRVLAVKDGEKDPLEFVLIDHQVVCSRNLKQPVVVEYVSWTDSEEHDAKIAQELEKLRPKG